MSGQRAGFAAARAAPCGQGMHRSCQLLRLLPRHCMAPGCHPAHSLPQQLQPWAQQPDLLHTMKSNSLRSMPAACKQAQWGTGRQAGSLPGSQAGTGTSHKSCPQFDDAVACSFKYPPRCAVRFEHYQQATDCGPGLPPPTSKPPQVLSKPSMLSRPTPTSPRSPAASSWRSSSPTAAVTCGSAKSESRATSTACRRCSPLGSSPAGWGWGAKCGGQVCECVCVCAGNAPSH